MAAFRGIHVSPAKHNYARLPRNCEYRTDRRTVAGQSDPYVPLCFQATQNFFFFWVAALVENQHKMHNYREFTCKRAVLLIPNVKSVVVLHARTFGESFCCKYFSFYCFLFCFSASFHANKGKFDLFLKIHVYLHPWFHYGKLPIILYSLLVLCNYCTSANNFHVSKYMFD